MVIKQKEYPIDTLIICIERFLKKPMHPVSRSIMHARLVELYAAKERFTAKKVKGDLKHER